MAAGEVGGQGDDEGGVGPVRNSSINRSPNALPTISAPPTQHHLPSHPQDGGGDPSAAAKARLIGIGVVAVVVLASLLAYLACLRLGQLSPRRRAAAKRPQLPPHSQQQQEQCQLSDHHNDKNVGLSKAASAERQQSLSFSDEGAGVVAVATAGLEDGPQGRVLAAGPARAVGVTRGYDRLP